MLLAISSATESSPSADALIHSHHGADCTCVHAVPTHARRPKNTKTISSDRPMPMYAYGCLPPV